MDGWRRKGKLPTPSFTKQSKGALTSPATQTRSRVEILWKAQREKQMGRLQREALTLAAVREPQDRVGLE